MIGADPRRISDLMARADATLVGQPEAKAALEMALFDIVGKLAGLPVAELLGGRCRDRLTLSVSLADPDFETDLAYAQDLVDQGVGTFKLKAGVEGHGFDMHRLDSLRNRFGDEIDLRVDYNQGLRPENALKCLRDIEQFSPSFIEQPVPASCWTAMAQLRNAIDTTLVADESVFTAADAGRAVAAEICDAISVKVMKSGGMRQVQAVSAIAEAAGLPCYGGDMFESGLAHLAGVHAVAATPNIRLGCEFYQASYYLTEDVLDRPFPVADGQVIVPQSPGLGIDVDEDRLARMGDEVSP
jgi:muconate cycloisomerase